jgi:hypothetical protein
MDTVKVAFRFVGDQVDPHHITETIGLQPTALGLKGEAREVKSRIPNPTSYWILDSSLSASEPLTDHLHHLLDLIEVHRNGVEQLKREGYKPNFFCGLFYTRESGYIMLDLQTLERVVRLGASIEINTYEDGEEDVD